MENKINFDSLIKSLPPMISRDHVEKYLGGVISPKTLANLDSEGKGPRRMRIGRKVPITLVLCKATGSPRLSRCVQVVAKRRAVHRLYR